MLDAALAEVGPAPVGAICGPLEPSPDKVGF
jgi:hypothetical protein